MIFKRLLFPLTILLRAHCSADGVCWLNHFVIIIIALRQQHTCEPCMFGVRLLWFSLFQSYIYNIFLYLFNDDLCLVIFYLYRCHYRLLFGKPQLWTYRAKMPTSTRTRKKLEREYAHSILIFIFNVK